jgi:hypothetical protein
MRYKYLVLIFLLTLFSCGQKRSLFEWRLKEINESYKEELSTMQLPGNMVNHFPENIERLPIKIYKSISESQSCMYFMLFEFNNDKNIQYNYIAKYQASNDSLLVIKRHARNTFISYKSYLRNDNSFYPIPFFEKDTYNNPEDVVTTEDVYSDSTTCGLSKDFAIYVIDFNPKFQKDEMRPLSYMPEGWKNGYSKGICINEKKGVIIYWVLIW